MVFARSLILVAVLLAGALPVAGDHASGIQWACGGGGGGASGHPDRCGIDPVGGDGVGSDGEPTWGAGWIDGAEQVLGVVVNGDARAVPVKMLDRHEILNDVIGGVPVAVTYCPLCGSGITFERTVRIDGQALELDFTASGFLYEHDLVMWDPQTETLWTQILGEPIGTLVNERVQRSHIDARLSFIPTEVVTWDDWQARHPDSDMLQNVPGFSYGGAYAGYDASCRFGISGQSDCDVGGLHPKELVYGVEAPTGDVAFPEFALRPNEGFAYDAEHHVAISIADGLRAYDTSGHVFALEGSTWRDADGDAWDLAHGRNAAGTEVLPELVPLRMFWFAWQTHHDGTALWLPADAEGAKDLEDNGKLPGFTIGIVALMLVVGALLWRRR